MATVEFDMDKILKGVENIGLLEHEIDSANRQAMTELYYKADAHIDTLAQGYGLDSSSLHKTREINFYPEYNEVSFEYTADYAKFVEFGTGIVGENNPYPDEDVDWEYNVGDKIQPDGHWVYKDRNGKFGITSGQPSRPIMYLTSQWAKTQVTRTFRKYLRRISSK